MTATIYVENQIVAIIAGPSDILYEKVEKSVFIIEKSCNCKYDS